MIDDDKDISFDLFGGPELRIEGESVRLSRLQAALLALVFASGRRGASRKTLVETLWTDGEERTRRRRLNQLLYSVKSRVSSGPTLIHTHDHVAPALDIVECDLTAFENALATNDFTTARNLRQRGFLSKISGFPIDAFQEWLEFRRNELHAHEKRILRKAWSDAEASADWGGAKEAAKGLLQLEVPQEALLQQAVLAFVRAGCLDEVDEAVQEFGRRKEDATGMPWVPSRETRDLLKKIQGTDGRLQTESPDTGMPPNQTSPFGGRKEELASLRRSLRQIPPERQRVLLVSGEGGIGKTRLISEALVGLRVEGLQVFHAQLADLERLIPLNPLIEALADSQVAHTLGDLAEPWRTVLYGAMPTHFPGEGPIPDPPEIQPGSVPRRLFEAIYQLFLALAENAPIVMVLEDLHWADETTLSVLEFLSRRWDLGRFQLVVSYRPEERDANPALTKLLRTLEGHPERVEIPLGELSPGASEQLIRHLSHGDLAKREVNRLISLAGGNPFFLIELTLERSAGRLELPSEVEDQLAIPLSIRQVLRQRLGQLSVEAEALLGALAVHRRPIETHQLGRLAKLSVAKCLEGLDDLHALRLVAREAKGVGIPHELIRHTVYQDLSDSRRAWLHERAARHLLRTRERPPVNELAIHFHQAGVTEEARRYGSQAAERAERAGAIPEALRFLRIVREHTEDPGEVADLLGRMGHLNYLHRNLREAAPLLEVASQRFRKHGRLSEALMFEIERIDSLAQTDLLPFPECLEELQRIKAEARAAEDWDVFTKALDVEAHHLDFQGNIAGVRRVLREAERSKDAGSLRARCQARATLAYKLFFGSPEEALVAARNAVGLAEKEGYRDLLLVSLNRLMVVLIQQGFLDSQEGKEASSKAQRLAETTGDILAKFNIHQNVAIWHLDKGEYPEAEVLFQRAERVIQDTRAKTAKINLHYNLGELAFFSHRIEAAEENFARALSLLGPSSPSIYQPLSQAGLGLCALFKGNMNTARAMDSATPLHDHLDHFDSSLVLRFKARILKRRGDLRVAVQLLEEGRQKNTGRLAMAWLKLTLEQALILRTPDPHQSLAVTMEGYRMSKALGLKKRESEFWRLKERLS